MALNIEKYFAYPFSRKEDFHYVAPTLYYVESFGEGEILLNIDSTLTGKKASTLGEPIFVYPSEDSTVAYFSWMSQYYRKDSLPRIKEEGAKVGFLTQEVLQNLTFFKGILLEHPVGKELAVLYTRKGELEHCRQSLRVYLGKQLEQPSVLHNFLSATGISVLGKHAYWRMETEGKSLVERVRVALNDELRVEKAVRVEKQRDYGPPPFPVRF